MIDVPVKITDPNTPLGTHVFTANGYTPGEKAHEVERRHAQVRLRSRPPRGKSGASAVTRTGLRGAAPSDDTDPAHALERIEIPKETVERLAELMKPGSSFIVSDYGLSRETSKRTDFIVEPWRSSTAPPAEYEGGRIE